MEHLHRAIGGIHPLPARARGAADGDLELVRADFNVHLLGFGEDRNRRGGSMDAAAGLGGGDALDAVDSTLIAEVAVDILPLHGSDDFLVAAERGRAGVDRLDLPPLRFRVAGVHAKEVGGEEGRLIPAGAGADLEDGVAAIVWIRREDGRLEIHLKGHATSVQLARLGLDHLKHPGLVLVLRAERLVIAGASKNLGVIDKTRDRGLEPRMLAGKLGGATRVGKGGAVRERGLDLAEALREAGVMGKEIHGMVGRAGPR